MTRQRAERQGRLAETIAAWWLRLHGWRILARRARTPRGEIDLVARRGRTVAFIEVKMRTRHADLATAIDRRRLKRVAAAAEILSARYARPRDDIRIDVMLIARNKLPLHLPNVWHG